MSAPNHSAGRHSQPSAEPEAEAQRDGQEDLEHAAGERHPAHRRQLAERHLEAEREQQQHHAELGHPLDVVDVADGRPAGERPDDHAGQDVADDQRLAEALREEAAAERGQQHEGEIGDQIHPARYSPITFTTTRLRRCPSNSA